MICFVVVVCCLSFLSVFGDGPCCFDCFCVKRCLCFVLFVFSLFFSFACFLHRVVPFQCVFLPLCFHVSSVVLCCSWLSLFPLFRFSLGSHVFRVSPVFHVFV